MYVIEALKNHDRKDFDFGDENLNRYFHERASQDIKRKLNNIFIIREKDNEKVLGYFTLSSSSVAAGTLPPEHARRLPKHPVPAALLGKLAVDLTWQGKGLGKLLVAEAIKRTLAADKNVAIHVLVVDPKNDSVIPFYTGLGFLHIKPEKRLFLFLSGL